MNSNHAHFNISAREIGAKLKPHGSVCPPFWILTVEWSGARSCLFLMTSPFSDSIAVLLRIRLSSTLQHRKRSPKTEPFENALQSGAISKRCFLKTLFSSVDGKNDAIWNNFNWLFSTNPLVYRQFSRTTSIHPDIFRGHYLNNRVFLSADSCQAEIWCS